MIPLFSNVIVCSMSRLYLQKGLQGLRLWLLLCPRALGILGLGFRVWGFGFGFRGFGIWGSLVGQRATGSKGEESKI